MKQCYHTIIMPRADGWYVGWVEEIRGTLTCGRNIDECRHNVKDALTLILQTHRHEATIAANPSCIRESIEIEVDDVPIVAM